MNGAEVATDRPCEVRFPTLREQLTQRRERLMAELQDVNTAMDLLDKNSEFERIHDAIAKLNVRGLLR